MRSATRASTPASRLVRTADAHAPATNTPAANAAFLRVADGSADDDALSTTRLISLGATLLLYDASTRHAPPARRAGASPARHEYANRLFALASAFAAGEGAMGQGGCWRAG